MTGRAYFHVSMQTLLLREDGVWYGKIYGDVMFPRSVIFAPPCRFVLFFLPFAEISRQRGRDGVLVVPTFDRRVRAGP